MNPFPRESPAAEILAQIREAGRPALGPGRRKDGPWRSALAGLSDERLLGAATLADPQAAACVRAGLLLFADDLEESHQLSQSIETPDGSYWHGILHRREGDFGNARYWFRQVGSHAIGKELAASAASRRGKVAEIGRGGEWSPFRMVDLVEACESGQWPELEEDLLDLQEQEMHLLLAHCRRKAAGGA